MSNLISSSSNLPIPEAGQLNRQVSGTVNTSAIRHKKERDDNFYFLLCHFIIAFLIQYPQLLLNHVLAWLCPKDMV
jgi:hypothetical protein